MLLMLLLEICFGLKISNWILMSWLGNDHKYLFQIESLEILVTGLLMFLVEILLMFLVQKNV